MKVCTKCGVEKPLGDFPKDKRISTGRVAQCRECVNRYKTRWMREKRHANPEWAREEDRRWREANPEAALAKDRRYKNANRKLLRERDRIRRLKNPERTKATYRRWFEANRKQELLRKANRRALMKNATPETLALVETLLTQPCAYCGSTERITIDHIIPLSRGGKHEADNLAPACLSCNSSKNDRLLSEWDGWEAA